MLASVVRSRRRMRGELLDLGRLGEEAFGLPSCHRRVLCDEDRERRLTQANMFLIFSSGMPWFTR